MEAQVLSDGAEPSVAMEIQEGEMAASVPHIQVHEAAEKAESDKLPTPEDVAGCKEICKTLLFLLEDWKITNIMPSGGQMNPPIIPKLDHYDRVLVPCRMRPGLATLGGFSSNLFKSF
ncbi:unnamed protein product [Prunus brigantina]